MQKPNDLNQSRSVLKQDSTLIAVIEMSLSSWLAAGIVPGVERLPCRSLRSTRARCRSYSIAGVRKRRKQNAGSNALPSPLRPAGTVSGWRAGLEHAASRPTLSTHPSVAVSREHRRAKTDRLDTELLKRAFLGWLRGERDHCKMVAIPTTKTKMPSGPTASARASSESKLGSVNRMKAALIRLGIRGFNPKLKKAAGRLEAFAHARRRTNTAQHAS